MTHTPENCPAYLPPDEQKKFFTEVEKGYDVAKQMNIDILFIVAGIGHTMYALVEADNFQALNMFLGRMPFKQDIDAVPVGHANDIMVAFREEWAKR
jgi:hypothetical protein